MQISSVIKACQYQIAEGGPFNWDCYGDRARFIEFTEGVSCVFNPHSGEVYEVERVHQDPELRWCWRSPAHEQAYQEESGRKWGGMGIDAESMRSPVILSEQKMLDVLASIFNDGKYESLELTFSDEERLLICDLAHKRDMSLNELFSDVMIDLINRHKQELAPQLGASKSELSN